MIQIVRLHAARYRSASTKSEQTKIIRDILDYVQSDGSRLLQQIESGKDEGKWVVISFAEALDYINKQVLGELFRVDPNGVRYREESVSAPPSYGATLADVHRDSYNSYLQGEYESSAFGRDGPLGRMPGSYPEVPIGFASAPGGDSLAAGPMPGWGATSSFHASSLRADGAPSGLQLQMLWAAHHQKETAAAAAASGGGVHKLTPREKFYLLQNGGSSQLMPAELLVLREQERERQMAFRNYF